MARRIYLLLGLLLVMGLACNLPIIGEDTPENDEVDPYRTSGMDEITVNPDSGKGPFTATVNYVWVMGDVDFKITCTYPDQNGNIISIDLPLTHKDQTYSFTILGTKKGSQNVSCKDSVGASGVAVFTVTGDESLPQINDKYTNATINFISSQVIFTSGSPAAGEPGDYLQGYCWPPVDFQNNGKSYFTVSQDGNLEGKCSIDKEEEHITGELSGQYDIKKNTVKFRLDTKQNYYYKDGCPDTRENSVIFYGEGPLVDNIAAGTADIIVNIIVKDTLSCADGDQHFQYRGTVPFSLVLLP